MTTEQSELAMLQEQRQAVREAYARHIQAASNVRREARRLDALIEKAKRTHSPTPKEG